MSDSVDEPTPMRVLKVGSAGSLSGKSTLHYFVGCSSDAAIHFRLHSNSGAGMFSDSWISMAAISNVLSKAQKITSATLQQPLYASRSQNSGGFLLACLVNEKLIASVDGNARNYKCLDPAPFLQEINARIATNVDLKESDISFVETAPGPSTVKAKHRKRAKA